MPLPPTLEAASRLDDDFAQRERKRKVEQAVQRLPPKLRSPIVLRHIEGLAYDQIARVLGVSIGTVASRVSRAHARLARELKGEV